jgi:UrcA family protein
MPPRLKMRTAIPFALLPLCIAGGAASANQIDTEQLQRIVKYGDLNLEESASAGTLYARIDVAAREVCDPPEIRGFRPLLVEINRCRAQAVAKAVADVDAPKLTSYYEARTAAGAAAAGR